MALAGLPDSSSAESGGSVLEARGEASYRVPIVVPPGPSGHQPNLELVYDSGEGRGAAGWLGFGWSLSGESRIERDTRTGTPYDPANYSCGTGAAQPCYRNAFTLDGQDLVCSGSSCTPCTSGTTSEICRYRTQSDDGRLIYYMGETAGWKVFDREGRTLIYGAAAGGRLVNPQNSSVFSWQIESSTDVVGNAISYQWDTTTTANLVYLKKVLYGPAQASADRSVEFILDTRPDTPVNARAGFRQQINRRVTQIVVSASNALVTRYDLAYSQDPDSTRSRLWKVTRKGSDNAQSSLPPYVFEYSQRDPSLGMKLQAEPFTGCVHAGGLYLWSNGDSNSFLYRNIIDLNRDGIGDVIDGSIGNDVTNDTRVSRGSGTGFLPASGTSCTAGSLASWSVWWSQPLFINSNQGLGGIVDLDGDGIPD